MTFEIPQSCALPTAERPTRLAEFGELLARATSSRRDDDTHLTLSFAGGDALEAPVRDLAARETSCCSFFEFDIARHGAELTVGIGVSAKHTGILDSLQARAGRAA